MSFARRSLLTFLIAIALPAGGAWAGELLLCGQDEIFAIDVGTAEQGKLEKLWSWRAKDRPELPEALQKAFGTTDECKPLDGGAKVLISSSGGGCALVERPSGRVLWYARVPNAHSIERLPHNHVVVASSVAGEGNRLVVFDLARSEKPLNDVPLPSAHGVVWDEARQRLWALGSAELHCYSLRSWDRAAPALALEKKVPLPGIGGHDLQAVPGGADLVVSTHEHVYLFDRERQEFRLHPDLGGKVNVKSFSIDPTTGRVAYIQAEGGNWWTSRIGLLAPAGQIDLPQERLYKVRLLPK
jgi:hypothetical protein